MVKRALTLLTSILIALSLLMPFNIYASATHLIQTEFLSTVSSEWRNSMTFTSYCEGTTASTASCVLTVNITKSPKNYFGTVTIHGYDSSGTKWINYGDIFVSSGTGVYNYNFYQNGIKEISRVEVYNINLIQPSSTVDLSQIISLLTSINNYEQQNKNLLDDIVDNTDTIEINQLENIQQIKNVISELVVSNGYLETLTKMREFDVYTESLPWCIYLVNYRYNRLDTVNTNNYYLNYPVFNMISNDNLWRNVDLGSSQNQYIHFVFLSIDWISQTDAGNLFQNQNLMLARYDRKDHSKPFFIYHLVYNSSVANNAFVLNRNIQSFIPIYIFVNADPNDDTFRISTDFAIQFGLKNEYLNNVELIANGTTESQSAADSSQSANEQLQTDSNTLFQQENGFKSDMQNAMQNVNTTFRLENIGTKFVSSAQWVRTQYELLTNNTPFASLITFSLITGLALILLGKVYK